MILVTGATGLNGKAIVREFARQKHAVRALVRDRNRAFAAGLGDLAGVDLVEGDMRRAETLGAALDGVDRVLMISTAGDDMTETQCCFIDACRTAGVGHVVKFSGRESNIGYDATKFRFTRMHEEVERYLEAAGMAWTHLRPSQFMQVYLRDAPTIAAEGAFYLALGDTELSPVDVEDIAKVAFRLLRDGGHAGESLDMTGPEALTMTEIAARISQAIGRPVRYVDISPEQRRRNLLAAGIPAGFADALDEQLAERRRRPKSRVHLVTHEMFGVQPTPFVEFARRHAAAFGGVA
ncbi:SDR family oxidoreductase [Mesorhizobium opportunistum]|uniref:NmrA family protein n=1 Tax=Mesorhizobium opportunistum (strain LMG 24607 / HAMBI 3007 / WSM2075) TaxID=536019 RepID=F7YBK9_MESOW|nr:SDR family oxidoreductase [Mesorhizobium opportunistum]AEH87756.1 NmrA family protein [Mesorhizobium opportunistum WSM2075]